MGGRAAVNLTEALGLDRHITFLRHRIIDDHASRLLLHGPSGSGKTTFVKLLAQSVEDSGCDVFWLRGDPGRVDEAYYPIRSALQPGRWGKLAGRGLRLVESLVEDFLPSGKATAKTVISLLPDRIAGKETVSLQASEIPREFLARLVRAVKSKHTLLIADDIQYFDENTLAFLQSLDRLQSESENFVGRLSLLSVENDDVPTRDNIARVLRSLTSTLTSVAIDRCSFQQFPVVLKAFGLNIELPPDMIKLLYDCSLGHLHVTKFICDELRVMRLQELNSDAFADLLQFVIQRRLEQVTVQSDLISRILSSAAFIGRTFSYQELACLLGIDIADIRQALRLAEALHFIECGDDEVRFSHEIMRTYFLRYALDQKSQFSAKYSQCLRVLRPADYFVRCITLLNAEDRSAAMVAYCQGVITTWRAGRTDKNPFDSQTSRAIKLDAFTEAYMHAMHKAHGLLSRGDFRAVRLLLDSLQGGVDRVLLAEKDYLYAEALLKDLGGASTREASRILNLWNDLREIEPELWCRMKLLSLLAHAQTEEYDELKTVEREIVLFLSARSRFDQSAQYQLNRLLATSEMHSSAEIAQKRIRQACEYYEKLFRDTGSADVYEYFICLTNRSGNAVTNRAFAEGFEVGCKALAVGREYSTIRFPAQWAAANNVVVNGVLCGRMTAGEGVECLRELLSRYPEMDDDVLIQSNIAGLALLCGDLGTASTFFDANSKRFADTLDIDPYYFYVSESNRALALRREGSSLASKLWEDCEKLVPRLAPAIRNDLRARHAAATEWFAIWDGQEETHAGASLDLPMAASNPISQRFPSGIFLTDVQIWSSF